MYNSGLRKPKGFSGKERGRMRHSTGKNKEKEEEGRWKKLEIVYLW